MTRITQAILTEAILELEHLGAQAQVTLADEVYARQPTLLGAVLVLKQFGASNAQIGIALHVMFVAWVAMKRCADKSTVKWPKITEDDHDLCMQRLTARINFIEDIPKLEWTGEGPAPKGLKCAPRPRHHPNSQWVVNEDAKRDADKRSVYVLWAVSIAMSYAPWWSSGTPIFGGTKHWMTAYPFLCSFAGLGFVQVCEAGRALAPRISRPWLVAGAVLLGPVVMTLHAHPFGLSAYTSLVGGAPGAASLGLNRTFWGYTTQELAPFVNQRAPSRGTVYVHDTALQSFAMFQEDDRLRRDLRGSLNIAASDVALYHHEPHMSRVEHQIWLEYGTVAPAAIATFDGVPIAWAYARPRRKK